MEKPILKQDNNIMSGKGEWDENEHPRDNEGRFTKKGNDTNEKIIRIKKRGFIEENKFKAKSFNESVKEISDINNNIKNQIGKQLINTILKFEPINLKIGEKEITVQFDKFSANKNVYSVGNSDYKGYQYKYNNIDKIPMYVKSSTYSHSKKEIGKNTPQHKGVKEWHYFINQVNTDKGVFDIVINIRDKGNEQFVYEVALKNKKPKAT